MSAEIANSCNWKLFYQLMSSKVKDTIVAVILVILGMFLYLMIVSGDTSTKETDSTISYFKKTPFFSETITIDKINRTVEIISKNGRYAFKFDDISTIHYTWYEGGSIDPTYSVVKILLTDGTKIVPGDSASSSGYLQFAEKLSEYSGVTLIKETVR